MRVRISKRRLGSLLSMAAVAALGLLGLSRSPSSWDSSDEDELQLRDMIEQRRFLFDLSSTLSAFPFHTYHGEEDYDAAYAAAAIEATPSPPEPIPPYTLEDALGEYEIVEYTFGVLIYNPVEDNFLGMYNKEHQYRGPNKKLWITFHHLTGLLRSTFPERFNSDQPEMVIAFGSGDYPHVRRTKLPYTTGKAPVLQFGSSFREKNLFPNMISMPMPTKEHLDCFCEYAMYGGRVCNQLLADGSTHRGRLTFGDEIGLKWEDLTPQLVWRGTDFSYLATLRPKWPALFAPNAVDYPSLKTKGKDKFANIVAELSTKQHDRHMPPRWRAAVLTAQADLEVQGTDSLPWADIKLSAYLDGVKKPTHNAKPYEVWEKNGIGIGKPMNHTTLAKYKYHIDLGGGGGTTWSGTIEKLAMPGLLFHHITTTKDYIHDMLTPWKHYIPVMDDLSDVRAKFDWAESHPVEAKSIADAATAFMRNMGKKKGFKKLFEDAFEDPMRRVIEAYRPVATVHPEMTSWKDYMGTDDRFVQVKECHWDEHMKCHETISPGEKAKWKENGHYIASKKKKKN